MKNIWESCTFSDEIISGNLDVSKFAVEELKAPTGKFRIISIDKWEPLGEGHAIFGDYDTLEEALTVARKNSHEFKKDQPDAGASIAVVYYVYDDKGNYKGGDIYKNE